MMSRIAVERTRLFMKYKTRKQCRDTHNYNGKPLKCMKYEPCSKGVCLSQVFRASVVLVCAAFVVFCAGCGKAGSSTSRSAADKADRNPRTAGTDASRAPASASVQIKGFHIGMDIKDIRPVLKQMLPEPDFDVSQVFESDGSSIELFDLDLQVKDGISKGDLYICITAPRIVDPVPAPIPVPVGSFHAKPDGRVDRIVFGPSIVDRMFGASNMGVEEFSHTLCETCKLPALKRSADEEPLIYSSPDGIMVTITRKKCLVIDGK